MKETTKLNAFRINNGYNSYFNGYGIDIGCQNDLLDKNIFKNITEIDGYDKEINENFDADFCKDIENDKYDFVYSSHCLEHMKNPYIAFQNWIRICKPNGYLIIAVPHEIFYEKCKWPSMFNAEHKTSWTLEFKSNLPNSINVFDFLENFNNIIKLISVQTILQEFDFNRFYEDQTMKNAITQIEFILQKNYYK